MSELLDDFTISGPGGDHQCIVSEAVGCSAADSKDENMPWKLPASVARSISTQALLGLDYIHSCGVVHGDLHLNNILFRMPDYGNRDMEGLYRRVGEPLRLPVQRLDQQPKGMNARDNYCIMETRY